MPNGYARPDAIAISEQHEARLIHCDRQSGTVHCLVTGVTVLQNLVSYIIAFIASGCALLFEPARYAEMLHQKLVALPATNKHLPMSKRGGQRRSWFSSCFCTTSGFSSAQHRLLVGYQQLVSSCPTGESGPQVIAMHFATFRFGSREAMILPCRRSMRLTARTAGRCWRAPTPSTISWTATSGVRAGRANLRVCRPAAELI